MTQVLLIVYLRGPKADKDALARAIAAVRAATGTPWNGFAFRGLGQGPWGERGERE